MAYPLLVHEPSGGMLVRMLSRSVSPPSSGRVYEGAWTAVVLRVEWRRGPQGIGKPVQGATGLEPYAYPLYPHLQPW